MFYIGFVSAMFVFLTARRFIRDLCVSLRPTQYSTNQSLKTNKNNNLTPSQIMLIGTLGLTLVVATSMSTMTPYNRRGTSQEHEVKKHRVESRTLNQEQGKVESEKAHGRVKNTKSGTKKSRVNKKKQKPESGNN